MADADILFRLTADKSSRQARIAVQLSHNQRWRTRELRTGADENLPCSRHATPAPDVVDDTENTDEADLEVRYSTLIQARNSGTLPPLNRGLLFGTDPKSCHVLLGRSPGTSSKHCGLFVDKQLRWYLRDFSTYGTTVSCDSQNADQRRPHEVWFLTESPNEQSLFREIVISIGTPKLRIDFPSHTAFSPQYEENARAFLNLLEDDADTFAALRIDSALVTDVPSGVATPEGSELYYQRRRLGKGEFASVYQAVHARSGDFVAMKVFPFAPDKRRLDLQEPKWLEDVRREFNLMRNHEHANIVEVTTLLEREHSIAIIMKYYPDGNIGDVQLDEIAYMSTFGQLLDGLQHLHSHGVTHRDLKPANILVRLHPLKVAIADFGLSKVATSHDSLQTFCGTLKYGAPEVLRRCDGYGTKADIWSLGVMAYEWIYQGLQIPKHPKNEQHVSRWSTIWCKTLQDALHDEEDCKLVTVLCRMIDRDAADRWSALQCLQFGFEAPPLFKRREHDNMVVCIDAVDDSTPCCQSSTGEKRKSIQSYQRSQTSATQTHLSIRSVMHSGEYSYMVVKRQRVSMHISSYDLNASEILACAKVDTISRQRYIKIFRNRKLGSRKGKSIWVPFVDGVYLCQAVGVFHTLRALLLLPGEDLEPLRGNYFLPQTHRKPSQLPHGFASLMCGEYEVIYKPKERMINARHIANISAFHPSKMQRFLARYTNDCVKLGGNQRIQGTYVTFSTAQQLCDHLNLVCQPLQKLFGLDVIADLPYPMRSGSIRHMNDCPEPIVDTGDEDESQILGGEDGYFWSSSLQSLLGFKTLQ